MKCADEKVGKMNNLAVTAKKDKDYKTWKTKTKGTTI